jgi:co-chaperonin GroES (HSP10)
MAYDWKKYRPLNDWVLVKDDKRPSETKGGIVLPDQQLLAERVMEGTGTVLKVGHLVKEKLGVSLEPGERVCFRGFLKDVFHEFNEEDGCRVFVLRAADVLMIIPKDMTMGMFS